MGDPIQIAASRGEVGQNLWVGSLDAITAWNYSLSPTEVLHTYQGVPHSVPGMGVLGGKTAAGWLDVAGW